LVQQQSAVLAPSLSRPAAPNRLLLKVAVRPPPALYYPLRELPSGHPRQSLASPPASARMKWK
jgi:hypothetical protein